MSKLTLDSVEWGEFRIKDLFELHLSKGDNQANLLDEGNIPLVSSGLNINGISKFIREGDGKSELFDGNILTVDMFGKAFYHEYNFFSVSHGRINILIPKFEITKFIAVFIVAEIDKNFSNVFSYNRMCSQKRLRSSKILLPIDYKGKPNWQFMEDYVKQEMKVQSSKVAAYYENKLMKLSFELLDLEVEWKEFKVKDIFEFKKKSSKGLNYLEKNDKGISYLGATNRNNGVLEFVKDDEKLKYKGNCIAFIRNGEGSMGYAVYKKEDFIATQDISVGYNDNLNLYTGTFITTIADRVRGKYNFGYKRNQNRLENEILHLPIDKNGEPHWEYMSQFMKKLEKENIEKTLNHIYIYNS
jgi:restriction enzyme, beta subunit/N-6 DNA methylase